MRKCFLLSPDGSAEENTEHHDIVERCTMTKIARPLLVSLTRRLLRPSLRKIANRGQYIWTDSNKEHIKLVGLSRALDPTVQRVCEALGCLDPSATLTIPKFLVGYGHLPVSPSPHDTVLIAARAPRGYVPLPTWA